jgi:hypothetical protein
VVQVGRKRTIGHQIFSRVFPWLAFSLVWE